MSEYSSSQLVSESVAGLGIIMMAISIMLIGFSLHPDMKSYKITCFGVILLFFSIICIVIGAIMYLRTEGKSDESQQKEASTQETPPEPLYQEQKMKKPKKKRGKPCPDCNKPMEWVDEWEKWYCENCDEYK